MNNSLKENIKKIRKENNLSQEELAEKLGVSRQAISKWESGTTYPEMDKLLSLCEMFHLNIDDLLHKDIKEVKGEEEAKNTTNKYVEGFFKFTTDTINLFSRMKFGSKVKCLLEQGCIALILLIISLMIMALLGEIAYHSPLMFLSTNLSHTIIEFLGAVYTLVAFVICIIIMVRIFKSRYLDYYEKVVKENKETSKESTIDVEKKKESIVLNEQNKIVIRDPKNSDYHFLRGLFKIFILGIKFFVLWIEFFLCIGLLFIATGFILSFIVSKTGLFFIGLLLGTISLGVMDVVVIVLLFNFIFDRKSNKKVVIWSFVLSVIGVGIGFGFVCVGALDFKLIPEETDFHTETKEIDMQDNLFIPYEVEYIPEERENVKIEYEIGRHTKANIISNSNGPYHIYAYRENEFDTFKEILKELNNKEIHDHTLTIKSIKIYASQTNIDKIENNQKNYYDREEEFNNREEEFRNRENELENLIEEKEETIQNLQNQIYNLEEENERLKEE